MNNSRILYLALGLFLSAAVIFAFSPSAFHMVSVWQRSDTFAHGMVVPFISLWLIWRLRSTLNGIDLRVDWRALAIFVVAVGMWAAGVIADAMVVQQFALVTTLISGVWLLYGVAITRTILFPLGFMYLAVPAGEFLIPHLVDLTAIFTVRAIRLTGIPIYVEGNSFMLPTGSWSVVSACSGIRSPTVWSCRLFRCG